MSRSNKNAANEDAVGLTHLLITKLTNMKLEHMLKMIESGELDPEIAINMRDVASAAKWVEYNQIGCQTADKDENSELSKNLKKIREASTNNVIQFLDQEY